MTVFFGGYDRKAHIAVKGIIWNRALKRILLVQRSANDLIGADTWETVGGSLEHGECLEEALKREIREEVGITDLTVGKNVYTTLVNGREPILIVAFFCETNTECVQLSFEHQNYLWADEDACRKLLPKSIINEFDKNNVFTQFENVPFGN